MNAEQFAFWVQGMLEYRDVDNISPGEAMEMLKGIKDHVQLVFNKVTPKPPEKVTPIKFPFPTPTPSPDQAKLWPHPPAYPVRDWMEPIYNPDITIASPALPEPIKPFGPGPITLTC